MDIANDNAACTHKTTICINPYEYVRKYRCQTCGEVMMCACDEEFARQYLPHQISWGTELDTQARIPVTKGFQQNICNSCRGIPEESHPKAEIYGYSSKIHRYYWREIGIETIRRFGEWAKLQGFEDWTIASVEHKEQYKVVEHEVVTEIKKLHQTNPKYIYQELSQNEILRKHNIEIVDLDGIFVKNNERKAAILEVDHIVSAEEYVIHHYQKQDYSALITESIPFHTLFGIFMWLVIQHPSDTHGSVRAFGDRNTFEKGEDQSLIWTILPDDFGTSGYYQRREVAINAHLQSLPTDKEELLWTFDYWVNPSYELRQYLWAHRDEDVEKAKKLINILPFHHIKNILLHLIKNYWKHYLGWPDLLLYREGDFFFVEVKASRDKLSEDQKNWIQHNSQILKLPFKLVKIHRKKTLDEIPPASDNI